MTDTRTINEVAKDEELRCAYAEIDTLKATIKTLNADLLECHEFIEPYSDVIDGDDGEQKPNRAMQLVSMIDLSIDGAF